MRWLVLLLFVLHPIRFLQTIGFLVLGFMLLLFLSSLAPPAHAGYKGRCGEFLTQWDSAAVLAVQDQCDAISCASKRNRAACFKRVEALVQKLPDPADTVKQAQCFLQVDGVVYMDRICKMTINAPEPGTQRGSFQLGVDETDVDYFVYINVTRPGVADGWWNGVDREGHADEPLPTLYQDGACWAGTRTKVCAWKIGERHGH